MKTVLLVFGLAIGALHAQGPDTNSVTGTWNSDFRMPDTTVVKPRLKLVHKDSRLTGVSMIRPGTEVPITNATVRGNQVRFEVVRITHGIPAVTRYAGKWNGDVIKGTMESNWSGQNKSYPWEAKRFSSLTGNWKWGSRTFGSRGETRAKLKFEDGQLTGAVRGRDGRDNPIVNATFENGEVSFEVERERDGFVFVQSYKGVFEGGTIVGTVEFITDDNPAGGRKSDWKAERLE
jgi:hypothetical protein